MFADLGEHLDDWLHMQHLRWIRFKRWCGWRPKKADGWADEWARMWSESVMDRTALEREMGRAALDQAATDLLNEYAAGKTVTWRKLEPLSPLTIGGEAIASGETAAGFTVPFDPIYHKAHRTPT